jgi:hypothetical protein
MPPSTARSAINFLAINSVPVQPRSTGCVERSVIYSCNQLSGVRTETRSRQRIVGAGFRRCQDHAESTTLDNRSSSGLPSTN